MLGLLDAASLGYDSSGNTVHADGPGCQPGFVDADRCELERVDGFRDCLRTAAPGSRRRDDDGVYGNCNEFPGHGSQSSNAVLVSSPGVQRRACSAFTSAVVATTPAQTPSVPGGLAANPVSSTQIDVSWTASATGPVTAYELQRQDPGGAMTTVFTGTATNFQDTGRNPATQYSYQVRACNGAACSAYASAVSATTPGQTPSVPGGLAANPVSATQIDVSWTASATGPVTAYELQRQDPGGAMTTVFTGTATNFPDTGRNPATQYSYQVRACNGALCSAYTSAVSATTPGQTPSAPTGLTATAASATQIDVSWTASATGPVTSYELQRQPAGGSFTTVFTGTATS